MTCCFGYKGIYIQSAVAPYEKGCRASFFATNRFLAKTFKSTDSSPLLIMATRLEKIGRFYGECVRVFRITKKPTKEEFKAIVKVSGLGILLIGLIGFIIHVIDRLLV